MLVTHLMREGEIALWHRGKIVWSGCLGAIVTGFEFDAVAISKCDLHRFEITSRIPLGVEVARSF